MGTVWHGYQGLDRRRRGKLRSDVRRKIRFDIMDGRHVFRTVSGSDGSVGIGVRCEGYI
jgi:hypothetical protein